MINYRAISLKKLQSQKSKKEIILPSFVNIFFYKARFNIYSS